ncbi:MAG: trypsin-like peptidase domain-containing protein [Clostridia bacterium]|nr:trypsin-like peptidase domain-containing protein [Clostridia bacterium]
MDNEFKNNDQETSIFDSIEYDMSGSKNFSTNGNTQQFESEEAQMQGTQNINEPEHPKYDQYFAQNHVVYTTGTDESFKKKPQRKHSPFRIIGLVLCLALVSVGSGMLGSAFTLNSLDPTDPTPTPISANGISIPNVTADDEGNSGTIVNITESTDSTVYSDVTSVVEAVIETVVGIKTDMGSGSGVIISTDGYIITCNHVIANASTIGIILHDDSQYTARLIGTDAKTDIAVLKIEATELSAATIGVSVDAKLGNYVVAVGNAIGELINSVSNGIISGLDRSISIEGISMTLMQTNAAVNPGNSGGGLFNMKGELIGIVNAKSTSIDVEGIGFAVPIDIASSISYDLITKGYVSGRPYLGISVRDIALSPGTNNNGWFGSFFQQYEYRAQVQSVAENSSAYKAGIEVGDYILAIDSYEIASSGDITLALYEYNAGDTVIITVQRNDQVIELTVVLDERSA